MKYNEVHRKVMEEMADSFRQFMRNGVCGTCESCHRDSNNHAYPEFCQNKTRDDHLIDPKEMFEHYESLSSAEIRKQNSQ